MRTAWLAFLLLLAPPARADVTLRLATLAPDGSAWMKLSRGFQKAVEAGTQGRVKLKFYTGGVQGDERDVLRKIKLGQLQGAAITAIGLANVDLEVRALDLARTTDELDALRSTLGSRLRARFLERGFVLLGWGDVGPVHLFSKNPVRSLADLRQARLWQWADDPVSRRLLAALEVPGVPLGVPDVLPALSTGSVDAFFASPLAALALQWSSYARYVASSVVTQATGATVIARAAWDQIDPADQRLILDEAAKLEKDLLARVREDNARALEKMKSQGLQVVVMPPEFEQEMQRRGEAVAEEIGRGLSQELGAEVRRVLEGMRRQASGKAN